MRVENIKIFIFNFEISSIHLCYKHISFYSINQSFGRDKKLEDYIDLKISFIKI